MTGKLHNNPVFLEFTMRHLLPLIVFLLWAFSFGVAAAADDPIAGLAFADGKARTMDDFKNQSLVLIYFCVT
jgi:hypothetical protein